MSFRQSILSTIGTLIVLLLLSLVAIQPLLHGRMPITDDGTLHLLRTIVLDHSLRYDDPIYPRFSSALVFGYGSPLFTYFSPLAYYLPRTLHILGLSFVQSWLWGMILYLWIALGGAYLLGKTWTNRAGGFACAAAYLYAPYILYDAVSRGTITEVAALAVLPWVLFTLKRLVDYPSAKAFAAATLCYAVFIPLHNIVTLHGSLLIVAYSLLLVAQNKKRFSSLLRLGTVGIVGLGLTAFFWLPALAETSLVRINAITDTLPNVQVVNHLRSWADVLALPHAVDSMQLQAPIPITISWINLLMGIVALVLSVRMRRLRGITIFCWVVTIMMLFMNTEASAWVWQNIPLLKYTQFAWRTLGLASLSLALLAAVGISLLSSQTVLRNTQNAICGVFVILTIGYGFSFTYRPYFDPSAESVSDIQNYERSTNEVSLSSYSEYLPIWVQELPDATLLISQWSQSPTISRLNNPRITIQNASWSGTSASIRYTSEEDEIVTFHWLYMPQWRVSVDNQLLGISPSVPEGLLQVSLPKGSHTLKVYYGQSLPQQIAITVSIITCLLGMGIALSWQILAQHYIPVPYIQESSSIRVVLGIIGISIFALKITVIDSNSNIFHQKRIGNEHFVVDTPVHASFEGGIDVIGYESNFEKIRAGEPLNFSTYWKLTDDIVAKDYMVTYSLKNSDGFVVSQSDTQMPAGISTRRWLSEYYVEDSISLPVDEYTSPGDYTLTATVYDQEKQTLVSTVNAAGNPDKPEVILSLIKLERASIQNNQADIYMKKSPFSITAITSLPVATRVGDEIQLSIIWKAKQLIKDAPQVQLRWKNTSADITTAPLDILSQAHSWSIGEQRRIYFSSYVPASLIEGIYDVSLESISVDGQIDFAFLGSLSVSVPTRNFVAPKPQYPETLSWSNGIHLIGYDLINSEITLYWQSKALINQSLKLFVHILDSNGTIIAQVDTIPANWNRPTTSWLPDEVITARYDFDQLPYDNYKIVVGWYVLNDFTPILTINAKPDLVLSQPFKVG